MTPRNLLKGALVLAGLCLAACAQDPLPAPELPSEVQKMEARVQEALEALDADYPPAYGEEVLQPRGSVVVPARSRNALADAVQEAGPYGTVLMKSGPHTEDEMVTISTPVRIIGEEGAYIVTESEPTDALLDAPVRPLIYVRGAPQTVIEGVSFRAQPERGNTAVLVHESPRTQIRSTRIQNFQFGIVAVGSDQIRLFDNQVWGFPLGPQEDLLTFGMVVSCRWAQLKGNQVSGFQAGIVCGDRRGLAYLNTVVNCRTGFLLLSPKGLRLPNNTFLGYGSPPANQWIVTSNTAAGGLWNYLLIDGAHSNWLYQNASADAQLYDVELAGESDRFGPLHPEGSFGNFVVSIGPFGGQRVKPCGKGNTVYGGQLVDTTTDPCF